MPNGNRKGPKGEGCKTGRGKKGKLGKAGKGKGMGPKDGTGRNMKEDKRLSTMINWRLFGGK